MEKSHVKQLKNIASIMFLNPTVTNMENEGEKIH